MTAARIASALVAALVAIATGCGGSEEATQSTTAVPTLEDCVERWNEGEGQLGIPAIAGDPGPYAGAAISVRVRPEPRPCLISIENDLGGWYQIAFRSDRPLSAESVQVKRSGTFREPFAEFGPSNALANASGRIELSPP